MFLRPCSARESAAHIEPTRHYPARSPAFDVRSARANGIALRFAPSSARSRPNRRCFAVFTRGRVAVIGVALGVLAAVGVTRFSSCLQLDGCANRKSNVEQEVIRSRFRLRVVLAKTEPLRFLIARITLATYIPSE